MNQPDREGRWTIKRGDTEMWAAVTSLERNEVYLPTGEAPYRITDLDDYEWTFHSELTPEQVRHFTHGR